MSGRYILILSYHLRLGTLNGFFHSGVLTEIVYAFFTSCMHVRCFADVLLLDLNHPYHRSVRRR
jgi:hypothetical protein